MLVPGKILEVRYEIKKIINEDEYGAVYIGSHINLNKQIIIKEINTSSLTERERIEIRPIFMEQARSLAKLNHPSIAKVLDFFPEGENFYLIIDYIDGQSIYSSMEMRKAAPYGEKSIIDYTINICRVVWFLHNQKPEPIILSNLNPKNIIFYPDRTISLLSNGMSKHIKGLSWNDKLGYTAPEIYRNQLVTQSDIFSIGRIMYYLATGLDPGISVHTNQGLPPINKINSKISYNLDIIIKKATMKDISDRYKTVKELKQALEECDKNPKVYKKEKEERSTDTSSGGLYDSATLKSDRSFKSKMEKAVIECYKDESTRKITKALENLKLDDDEPVYEIGNNLNEDPFEKISRERTQKAEKIKARQKASYEAVDKAFKEKENEERKETVKNIVKGILNYLPFKKS